MHGAALRQFFLLRLRPYVMLDTAMQGCFCWVLTQTVHWLKTPRKMSTCSTDSHHYGPRGRASINNTLLPIVDKHCKYWQRVIKKIGWKKLNHFYFVHFYLKINVCESSWIVSFKYWPESRVTKYMQVALRSMMPKFGQCMIILILHFNKCNKPLSTIYTQARRKRCGMAAVAAPKICRENERKGREGRKKEKRGERKERRKRKEMVRRAREKDLGLLRLYRCKTPP